MTNGIILGSKPHYTSELMLILILTSHIPSKLC